MPILDVDHAKSIVVIKRSMGRGYAGIDNELYTNPKTGMLFADAKDGLAAADGGGQGAVAGPSTPLVHGSWRSVFLGRGDRAPGERERDGDEEQGVDRVEGRHRRHDPTDVSEQPLDDEQAEEGQRVAAHRLREVGGPEP